MAKGGQVRPRVATSAHKELRVVGTQRCDRRDSLIVGHVLVKCPHLVVCYASDRHRLGGQRSQNEFSLLKGRGGQRVVLGVNVPRANVRCDGFDADADLA